MEECQLTICQKGKNNMFQFNSELYELTQKYQELTKQENAYKWQLLKQDMLILLIGATIIITLSLIVIRVHEAIVDKKLEKLKTTSIMLTAYTKMR